MKKILSIILCLSLILGLAAVVSAAPAAGDYAIVFAYEGKEYAMGHVVASNNKVDVAEAKSDSPAWTVAPCGDGVSLHTSNGYLAYTDGTNVVYSDTAYQWNLTDNGDGTYKLIASTNDARALSLRFYNDAYIVGAYAVSNETNPSYSAQYSFNLSFKTTTGSSTATPVEPEPEPEMPEPVGPQVSDPVEGTAYKLGLLQVKTTKVLYVDGTVSGRYLGMTEDANAAVDVYVEAAEGGYKLYTLVDDVKNYIVVYLNDDNKVSVKYDSASSSIYTYVAETNNWVTTLGEDNYYLGTYNNFNTISASLVKYISAENTGVSQFPAVLFSVPVDQPTPPPSDTPSVDPDPSNPKDGDSISVFVALMAVSAVGAAVIIKKKEF